MQKLLNIDIYSVQNDSIGSWGDNFSYYLRFVILRIWRNEVVVNHIRIIDSLPEHNPQHVSIILLSDAMVKFLDRKDDWMSTAYVDGIWVIPLPLKTNNKYTDAFFAYEFYQTIENQFIEFDFTKSGTINSTFWLRFIDLAYHVLTYIKYEDAAEIFKGLTVYLAETTDDQTSNREILKRELLRRGVNILPDKPIDWESAKLQHQLYAYFEQTNLVIHILGEKTRDISDGDIRKIEIQNKYAADYFRASKKQILNPIAANHLFQLQTVRNLNIAYRFVWLSPDLEPNEDQGYFIENLRRDADLLYGAELIQTPLEIFKSIVISSLQIFNNLFKDLNTNDLANDKNKLVYFIADSLVDANLEELISLHKTSGYIVRTIDNDGTQAEKLDMHRNLLIMCDIVVLYHNNDNSAWLDSKLKDIMKSKGFGRNKPFERKILISNSSLDDLYTDSLEDFEIIYTEYPDYKLFINDLMNN